MNNFKYIVSGNQPKGQVDLINNKIDNLPKEVRDQVLISGEILTGQNNKLRLTFRPEEGCFFVFLPEGVSTIQNTDTSIIAYSENYQFVVQVLPNKRYDIKFV